MYIGRFVLEPLHTKSYTTDSSSCVHKDIHAHTHTQTHTHIYAVTTQNKYILQNISNRIWEGLLEIQLHGAAFFRLVLAFYFPVPSQIGCSVAISSNRRRLCKNELRISNMRDLTCKTVRINS